MAKTLKFTWREIGNLIGIVSELDPDTFEETWAKAIILKAKTLYEPTSEDPTKIYAGWKVK